MAEPDLQSRIAADERHRIDRFEAAYNRIDRALSELADKGARAAGRRHTFAARVRIAAHRWRRLINHVDFLLEVGELRNALVHSRTDRDVYIAVPNAETVERLEAIERTLFAPERVIPRFRRAVQTLRADQTLAEAWQLVRDDGYSRYPIYDQGGFAGLLTSNGFARWVAGQARGARLQIDASQVRLGEVLAADHRRDFVTFVAQDAALVDVAAMFADNRQLEAVLVTATGRREEQLIGMICSADIVAVES